MIPFFLLVKDDFQILKSRE